MSDRRLLAALKRVPTGRVCRAIGTRPSTSSSSRALGGEIAESVVRERVGHVDRDVMERYAQIALANSQEAIRKPSRCGPGPDDPAPG